MGVLDALVVVPLEPRMSVPEGVRGARVGVRDDIAVKRNLRVLRGSKVSDIISFE